MLYFLLVAGNNRIYLDDNCFLDAFKCWFGGGGGESWFYTLPNEKAEEY